jgi:hypothetical protein
MLPRRYILEEVNEMLLNQIFCGTGCFAQRPGGRYTSWLSSLRLSVSFLLAGATRAPLQWALPEAF